MLFTAFQHVKIFNARLIACYGYKIVFVYKTTIQKSCILAWSVCFRIKQVFKAKARILWWTCCWRECNEFPGRHWSRSDSWIRGLSNRLLVQWVYNYLLRWHVMYPNNCILYVTTLSHSSWHTVLECRHIHNWTPVFSRWCLSPCVWVTDIRGLRSESLPLNHVWYGPCELFPVRWMNGGFWVAVATACGGIVEEHCKLCDQRRRSHERDPGSGPSRKFEWKI